MKTRTRANYGRDFPHTDPEHRKRMIGCIEQAISGSTIATRDDGIDLDARLKECQAELQRIQTPHFLSLLVGTIGLDVIH